MHSREASDLDLLAADGPWLTTAFAPQGSGHGVLPPGVDVDRVDACKPWKVPTGDIVLGGLVELVGTAIGARR